MRTFTEGVGVVKQE